MAWEISTSNTPGGQRNERGKHEREGGREGRREGGREGGDAGIYLPISSVIWLMKGSKASRAACSEGNLALIKSIASKSWG